MIHIACAADRAYLAHAAAMLHSVFSRPGAAPVQAHFLHPAAMEREPLDMLAAWAEQHDGHIHFHPIDEAAVAGLPEMGRISRVMWYRLFLPELLPDVDRVLYLDCDVLVREPLDDLCAMALDGAPLAAVRNVFDASHRTHASGLSLRDPPGYFNSGVLLIDLAKWRRDGLSAQILNLVKGRSAALLFPDQDALNLVFDGRWLPLHPRWNCQNSFFYFGDAATVVGRTALSEAVHNPGIIHFEGGELAKPWHYLCKNPFRDEYFKHRKSTPWPDQPLEGRTWMNRMLRLLPRRQVLPALRLVRRLTARGHRAFARSSASP